MLEFDDMGGEITIVERLSIKNPSTTEFFLTMVIYLAIGTGTEKIVINALLRIVGQKLGVDSPTTRDNRSGNHEEGLSRKPPYD